MALHSKKEFMLGFGMMVGFVAVFAIMFMPVFGGENAFHAADRLFNSISKGSSYYIPELREKATKFEDTEFTATIEYQDKALGLIAKFVLEQDGLNPELTGGMQGGTMKISGTMGQLTKMVLRDSDEMFHNDYEAMKSHYQGVKPKTAMYAWHATLKGLIKHFQLEKKHLKEAAMLKDVVAKGVEVGYNYFGIEPRAASDNAFILIFSMVFYVVYTMWYGYSIFFMSEGWGLRMTKGAKKE